MLYVYYRAMCWWKKYLVQIKCRTKYFDQNILLPCTLGLILQVYEENW